MDGRSAFEATFERLHVSLPEFGMDCQHGDAFAEVGRQPADRGSFREVIERLPAFPESGLGASEEEESIGPFAIVACDLYEARRGITRLAKSA